MATEQNGNHQVQLFEIIGRINDDNAIRLTESLQNALTQGRTHLVLDLGGVEYMNSAGLRALVDLFKHVERIGGRLTIANPSDRVMLLFQLVGLDSVFDIEENGAPELTHEDSDRTIPYREVVYFA